MSYNLPKVLKRVEDIAQRTMEQNTSGNAVLNQAINQYALPLIRFKQTGMPPDMGALEDLAGKLTAIVAATYDMTDMRNGTLP